MFSGGHQHNSGTRLATYLMADKADERAELWELSGFASADIKDAFRDIDIMSGATKCQQPFFHAHVRNPDGTPLERQQWKYAADRIEKKLGLTGQPRAIVSHINNQTGEEHIHIAWSRLDPLTLKAKHLPYFQLRMKEVSRELELHFGMEPVTNHRKGPIKYGPTRAEHEQAQRLGTDIEAIRNTIRHCWSNADSGKAFDDALAQNKMILAKGDRAYVVVIDHAGGIHSLGQRIIDIPAARIRQHLSDIDHASLPTIDDAKEKILGLPNRLEKLERELAETNAALSKALGGLFGTIRDKDAKRAEDPEWQRKEADRIAGDRKIAEQRREEWIKSAARERQASFTPGPEIGYDAGQIRLASALTDNGKAFAEAIEDRGYILACLTGKEAERLTRWERLRVEEIAKSDPAAARTLKDQWMYGEAGAEGLNGHQRDAAHERYDQWKYKDKRSFDDYVSFVQKQKSQEDEDRSRKLKTFTEGELVVVSQLGHIYKLTDRNTGQTKDQRDERLADIDRTTLISASQADAAMLQFRAIQRAERDQAKAQEQEPPRAGTRLAEIREMYVGSAKGKQFEDAVERAGYVLAYVSEADAKRLNKWERLRLKEQKREQFDTTHPTERFKAGEIVVMDRWGTIHQLTNRSTGDSLKWREQKLEDIDRKALLNVSAADSVMQKLREHERQESDYEYDRKRNERQHAFNDQFWPSQPQPTRNGSFESAAEATVNDKREDGMNSVSRRILQAWRESDKGLDGLFDVTDYGDIQAIKPKERPTDFIGKLDDQGVMFARVGKQEAARSHMDATFAKAVGNYTPKLREGEIVIVTEPPLEYRRDGQTTTPNRVHRINQDVAKRFAGDLPLSSIADTIKLSDARSEKRRDDLDKKLTERATDIKDFSREISNKDHKAEKIASRAAVKSGEAVLGVAEKSLDFISGMIDSLFTTTPEQRIEAEIAFDEREDQMEQATRERGGLEL